MVKGFTILRLGLPELEDPELVNRHGANLTAPPAQEGFLGFITWKPPTLAEIHVRELLVEVKVATSVLK